MDHLKSVRRLAVTAYHARLDLLALENSIAKKAEPTPADAHRLVEIARKMKTEAKIAETQVEEWAAYKSESN